MSNVGVTGVMPGHVNRGRRNVSRSGRKSSMAMVSGSLSPTNERKLSNSFVEINSIQLPGYSNSSPSHYYTLRRAPKRDHREKIHAAKAPERLVCHVPKLKRRMSTTGSVLHTILSSRGARSSTRRGSDEETKTNNTNAKKTTEVAGNGGELETSSTYRFIQPVVRINRARKLASKLFKRRTEGDVEEQRERDGHPTPTFNPSASTAEDGSQVHFVRHSHNIVSDLVDASALRKFSEAHRELRRLRHLVLIFETIDAHLYPLTQKKLFSKSKVLLRQLMKILSSYFDYSWKHLSEARISMLRADPSLHLSSVLPLHQRLHDDIVTVLRICWKEIARRQCRLGDSSQKEDQSDVHHLFGQDVFLSPSHASHSTGPDSPVELGPGFMYEDSDEPLPSRGSTSIKAGLSSSSTSSLNGGGPPVRLPSPSSSSHNVLGYNGTLESLADAFACSHAMNEYQAIFRSLYYSVASYRHVSTRFQYDRNLFLYIPRSLVHDLDHYKLGVNDMLVAAVLRRFAEEEEEKGSTLGVGSNDELYQTSEEKGNCKDDVSMVLFESLWKRTTIEWKGTLQLVEGFNSLRLPPVPTLRRTMARPESESTQTGAHRAVGGPYGDADDEDSVSVTFASTSLLESAASYASESHTQRLFSTRIHLQLLLNGVGLLNTMNPESDHIAAMGQIQHPLRNVPIQSPLSPSKAVEPSLAMLSGVNQATMDFPTLDDDDGDRDGDGNGDGGFNITVTPRNFSGVGIQSISLSQGGVPSLLTTDFGHEEEKKDVVSHLPLPSVSTSDDLLLLFRNIVRSKSTRNTPALQGGSRQNRSHSLPSILEAESVSERVPFSPQHVGVAHSMFAVADLVSGLLSWEKQRRDNLLAMGSSSYDDLIIDEGEEEDEDDEEEEEEEDDDDDGEDEEDGRGGKRRKGGGLSDLLVLSLNDLHLCSPHASMLRLSSTTGPGSDESTTVPHTHQTPLSYPSPSPLGENALGQPWSFVGRQLRWLSQTECTWTQEYEEFFHSLLGERFLFVRTTHNGIPGVAIHHHSSSFVRPVLECCRVLLQARIHFIEKAGAGGSGSSLLPSLAASSLLCVEETLTRCLFHIGLQQEELDGSKIKSNLLFHNDMRTLAASLTRLLESHSLADDLLVREGWLEPVFPFQKEVYSDKDVTTNTAVVLEMEPEEHAPYQNVRDNDYLSAPTTSHPLSATIDVCSDVAHSLEAHISKVAQEYFGRFNGANNSRRREGGGAGKGRTRDNTSSASGGQDVGPGPFSVIAPTPKKLYVLSGSLPTSLPASSSSASSRSMLNNGKAAYSERKNSHDLNGDDHRDRDGVREKNGNDRDSLVRPHPPSPFMKRVVEELMEPLFRTSLSLSRETHDVVLVGVVDIVLRSLVSFIDGTGVRFNQQGVLQLGVDIRYVKAWLRHRCEEYIESLEPNLRKEEEKESERTERERLEAQNDRIKAEVHCLSDRLVNISGLTHIEGLQERAQSKAMEGRCFGCLGAKKTGKATNKDMHADPLTSSNRSTAWS